MIIRQTQVTEVRRCRTRLWCWWLLPAVLLAGFLISGCGRDPFNATKTLNCANPNYYKQNQASCKAYFKAVEEYQSQPEPEPFMYIMLFFLLASRSAAVVHPHALVGAPCPSILFAQAPHQATFAYDSNDQTVYTAPLYRQADGSFTAQGFSGPSNNTKPVGTYLGPLAQAQAQFTTCISLPAWTPKPHPSLMGDLPGAMARSQIAANLGGSSYISIRIDGGSNMITVGRDSQTTLGALYTDYPVGNNPVAVLAADFNGDGKRDVAVLNQDSLDSNSTGQVSILLGNGDGTLKPAANFHVGNFPTAMTWSDFNHDGRADLAVVNQDDNSVTVLTGNPDGSLRTVATYPLPGSVSFTQAPSIVAADFDGDGKTDLLVAESGFSLLRGNGDGTFQAAQRKTGYTPNFTTAFLAAGDFNKDNKTDLASYNVDGTVAILLNAGDGSFPSQNRFVAGTPLSAGSLTPGMFAMDFNDDGNLDLVFANGHPDALLPNPFFVTVLPGNGDGTFQSTAPAWEVGPIGSSMAMADFNGDGIADLAVVSLPYGSGSGLWILLGKSGGGFQAPTQVAASIGTPVWVATADLNGDGHPDIVTIDSPFNGTGHVYTLLGRGDGTFQAPSTYPAGNQPTFVTAGDLNGDGLADLVIAYGNTNNTTPGTASVAVMLGKASGGFNAATNVTTGNNTIQVALADVNGDGKLDLIAVNAGIIDTGYTGAQPAPGNVSVLLGKGDGSFQAPANYTVGVNPLSVAVGDVNGDGNPDLVVGTDSDTAASIAVLLGSGNGTFAAPASLISTYSWPLSVTLADFDGDGKLDLAIEHQAGDPAVTIMPGNGDGTFLNELDVFAGDGPVALAAADFTGKGRTDFAILNTTQLQGFSTVHLFHNISPAAACSYSLGASSQSIAAAGEQGFFKITAGNGCDWAAVSNAPTWLKITSNEFGTGVGTISFSVAANTGAARSGTITVAGQTYTISQMGTGTTGGGTPMPVSVTQPAGSGLTQTFTFTFSDTGGWQSLNVLNVIFQNNFINGIGACFVAVLPQSATSATVYLVDDAGDAGGPFAGGFVLPASNTIQNSQCALNGAGSSVSGSGNTYTVTLAVTFQPAFAGNKIIYMAARENGPANSGWQALGTWNVPGTTPSGPYVGGVTPAHVVGTGQQTYVFTFNDTNGISDMGVLNVLINDSLNGNQACYLAYARAANQLYLVNDAGNGLLTPMTLNGSGTLGNSQCTVNAAGSGATTSGNTLTLTLNMTIPSTFAGNRVVYMAARSNGDVLNSGWQSAGTRTLQ